MATQTSMSGYLSKKKPGFFGGWQKGWWVLNGDTWSFTEYSSPGSTQGTPLSEIDPYEVRKVQKKPGGLLIVVLNGGEQMALKALDECQQDRWVDVFGEFLVALPTERGGIVEARPQSKAALTKKDTMVGLSVSTGGRDVEGEKRQSSLASPVDRTSRKFDAPSKTAAAIMDTQVFMGKARNFAVSTNKDFAESVKRKGGYTPVKRQGTDDLVEDVGMNKRAAVVPIMTAEEHVDPGRFVKTPEQNEKLKRIMVNQFSDFLGGSIFKEVEPQAVLDLMFQVKVEKNVNLVTQGEPTDRMFVIESGTVGVYTQDFVDRPPELELVKKQGDLFGVLSLLYNQPGPFTIKAHSDCVLWALPRRKYHELTTNETKRRVARKVRLLEGVPLIADNLDQGIIVQLADSMEFQEYENGITIITAGVPLTKVYIVGEGEAQLVDKNGVVQETLVKGDAYGEWALLDIGSKSEANLVAKGHLAVLALEVKEVEELVGPLRAVVLRNWTETRGDQFFFQNTTRGGTIFNAESDVRNPLSRGNATVQFGTSATAGVAAAATIAPPSPKGDRVAISDGAVALSATLTKEQEDAAIAEAVKEAKSRTTQSRKSHARKTRATKAAAKKEKETAAAGSIVTVAAAAPMADVPAEVAEAPAPAKAPPLAPVQIAAPAVSQPINPSPSGQALVEVQFADDDEEEDETDVAEDEENLDKPFDPAPPLRPDLTMVSIKFCALLGRGNFGRVHLARNESNHGDLFAVKVLGRHFIVHNGWETLVENERNSMLELAGLTKSPFLLMLYNSWSDRKNIYLLLELCEGGDLYNLLRITKSNRFNEEVARFYMACVVMGLEAMHSRELVYRDLKPENLMISRNGYVKVADFGLAKKTLRTFTVCGTPDYMAPEVILSRGHGMPVDWWALGVLLYEMVTAITPFFGNEAMDIYENVLAHEKFDDLEFPDDVAFSAEGKKIVKQLCHPKKHQRLGIKFPGVKGVKTHPYFKGFDWALLASCKMPPPIMPTIVDMTKYTTGTVTYDAKLLNVPDDDSDWKLNF